MMKALEFASILKKIATQYTTLYVYGCFGAHLRSDNVGRYVSRYAYNQDPTRLETITNNLDKGVFGFDCVCLIKGVLWGWNGNLDAHYGGAVYKSNDVPDVGANRMMDLCLEISEDFSNISVGELLWIKDHCGVYIGDGLVVECTPKWKNGVQITALANLENPPDNYNQRRWTKHGKLPFIEYEEKKISEDTPEAPTIFSQNKPSFMEILRRILDLILSFLEGSN